MLTGWTRSRGLAGPLLVLGLIAAVLIDGLGGSPVSAQDERQEVTILGGSDALEMEQDEDGKVTGKLVIANSGTVQIQLGQATVSAFYSDGEAIELSEEPTLFGGAISPGESGSIALSFNRSTGDPLAGTLLVAVPEATVVNRAFLIEPHRSVRNFWIPVGVALATGLIWLVVTYFVAKARKLWEGGPWLRSQSGWTFKESWVANVAVLLPVAVTIASSTELVSISPDFPKEQLIGLNAIFGTLSLGSPLLIGLLRQPADGADKGLVLKALFWFASAVVVASVGGELATLALFICLSTMPFLVQLFLCLLLSAGALSTAFYAASLFVVRMTATKPAPKPPGIENLLELMLDEWHVDPTASVEELRVRAFSRLKPWSADEGWKLRLADLPDDEDAMTELAQWIANLIVADVQLKDVDGHQVVDSVRLHAKEPARGLS